MNNFTYRKNKSDISIFLSTKGLSKISSFILIILTIVPFLLPIIFFGVAIKNNVPINISFILTIVIFWGTSFFFLRKFLWNKYGKEVYIIKSDLLQYSYNYNLYIDNFEEIFEPIVDNIGLIDTDDKMIYFKDINLTNIDASEYKIFFETKDKLIKTTQYVYIHKKELMNFIEFLQINLPINQKVS